MLFGFYGTKIFENRSFNVRDQLISSKLLNKGTETYNYEDTVIDIRNNTKSN